MVSKYALALALGGVVTFGLLFTMQALIATSWSRLDESGTRHFVDFVRVERDETLQRKERRPDKPAEPLAAPPQALPARVDPVDPGQMGFSVPVASLDMEMSIAGLGLVASDGDYLPIVKIAPAYPVAAQTRGIEGYCTVEYTVTTTGTIKDVVVIDAQPKGLFDKASIEAALRFKYRPRVVNGEPIEVRGVQNLFRYQLEN